MAYKRVGVIMAGGSGERFWPVSKRHKPKQFLKLGSPTHSLLQEAVDRASSLFGASGTYIATGEHLVEPSTLECPDLSAENILAEPAKRNTTGCLVWAAANLMARNEDWSQISMAILTADHRIDPTEGFHKTVVMALDTAEQTGGLVTIGIRPTRPETGYGYLELGEQHGAARVVQKFREKPDQATADSYMASGQYLWNAGMFFWTLPAFVSELRTHKPEAAEMIGELAGLIKQGRNEECKAVFERLDSVSIDYALMEKASKVFVVEAAFDWDDLGSWDSLRRSYPQDETGNVTLGANRLLDCKDTVVYNDNPEQNVCMLGVEGLVVVVSGDTIMICPADQAQNVRRFSQS